MYVVAPTADSLAYAALDDSKAATSNLERTRLNKSTERGYEGRGGVKPSADGNDLPSIPVRQ